MSLKERFNAFRERVNIRLYNSRGPVLAFFSRGSLWVALITLTSLVFYHGYKLSPEQNHIVGLIVRGSIAFYLLKFLIEVVYHFRPKQLFLDRKWETALMIFLFLDILCINLFDFELMNALGSYLGIRSFRASFLILIQVYFIAIVGLEFGKVGELLPKSKISPPAMLVMSFMVLILLGTGMLMLPEMSVGAGGLQFFDAAFMSISASCVTGLSVIDVSTVLTTKGHIVILVLMQLGGLNIISFAAIFAMLRGGFGIRQQNMLSENMGENLMRSNRLLKNIFKATILIELLGAALLFWTWDLPFKAYGEKLFYSIFHSVSAFNNAGFSLFSDSLATDSLATNFSLQWVIAVLIILGGLGFGVMTDMVSRPWKSLGIQRAWRELRVISKLSLISTAVLIALGMLVFFGVEYASKGDFSGHAFMASFFQSVTARTAGFNTVDFGNVGVSALLFIIFLMFIGGGSGSTAGGIKTSTFSLVVIAALSTIKGKKNVNMFRFQIPWDLLNRAFAVFLFTAVSILLGIFALTLFEPNISFAQLAFEEVSAFCTVGLSTGITADLSAASKVVLMLSMIVGRVGTLTLAFALSGQRRESNAFKYPKANFPVG